MKERHINLMNKVIRTVIIDDSSLVVNNLKAHFASSESVKVTAVFTRGDEAFNFIVNHHNEIDLILMDILIPGIDGLTFLSELKERNINKKIIVVSSYKDEVVINRCSNYNVSYYIIKPFSILALEKRIKELFNSKSRSFKNQENIDLEISDILHNLGIPSHIRGYKYIREGIIMIYNNDSLSFITKEIYPQIACKYDTTPSRVERAIRHAIEVSWIRGDLALMEELFGFSVSCDKAKPTNSEFLSTIADRIKLTRSALK